MSSEFLEQAWLKSEKNDKSPHIVIMTKRFNDVSMNTVLPLMIIRGRKLLEVLKIYL